MVVKFGSCVKKMPDQANDTWNYNFLKILKAACWRESANRCCFIVHVCHWPKLSITVHFCFGKSVFRPIITS